MRNSVESLIQSLGIEDRSLEKTAGEFPKVAFPPRGQVVQDGDRSLGPQMAGKMAANEAGASCD